MLFYDTTYEEISQFPTNLMSDNFHHIISIIKA